MPFPDIKGYISSTTHIYNNEIENTSFIEGNTNFGPAVLSVGVGSHFSYSEGEIDAEKAVEVKAKFNLGNGFSSLGRFRAYGDVQQYRATFGKNFKIDENNSIYLTSHITTSHKNHALNTKAGGWVGFEHKFKDGSTIFGEIQQNFPLSKPKKISDTLGNFKAGDTFVNVGLKIPIL